MPRSDVIQTNFSAGELSRRLFGRTDLQKYRNGCAELTNFIPQTQGGIMRRSGTRFVREVKNSNVQTVLLPFAFSNQQTYVLEVGDQYIRFYRNRGRLQHGTVFTVTGAVWAAGTSTLTIGNHDLVIGDQISVQGVLTNDATFPHGFNGTFIVTAVAATTVSYAQAVQPPGAWVAGGTQTVRETSGSIPTEIATPYLASDDLRLVRIAQSADVMYLVHPLYQPRTLSRRPGADVDPQVWVLSLFTNRNGPYLPINIDDTATLTAPLGSKGATVTVTVNNAAVNLINDRQGFISTDVGRLLAWADSDDLTRRWGTITVVNSRTSVNVLLGSNSEATTTDFWRLGAWSNTTRWPRALTFHQQRLYFAGTEKQPQTVWASAIDDFTNFALSAADGTVLDTHAIDRTIDDDLVNQIEWMRSTLRGLAIFTDGGIFVGGTRDVFDAPAPANFAVTRQADYPASRFAAPQRAGSLILSPVSADREVREFVPHLGEEAVDVPDLTILAEHITISGLIATAYQRQPDSILWSARADGSLLGMTYERAEEVVSWHRHPIGGSGATVESLTLIRDGIDDLLWMVVRRTIAGVTRRYIEFLEPLFKDDQAVEDAFFVDSGLTYDGPAEDVIGGLEHLIGETVSILADGGVHPSRVVDVQGQITLEQPATVVQAGLLYTSRMTTLPAVGPESAAGDPRGKVYGLTHAVMRLLRSIGGSIGGAGLTLDPIVTRQPSDPMDQPTPPFTGQLRQALTSVRGEDLQVVVESSDPLPFGLLSLALEAEMTG